MKILNITDSSGIVECNDLEHDHDSHYTIMYLHYLNKEGDIDFLHNENYLRYLGIRDNIL